MPLEQYQQPPAGRPKPPAGLIVGLVGASAVATAVLIVVFLDALPLSVRLLLAAAELLISSLACWAMLKAARR